MCNRQMSQPARAVWIEILRAYLDDTFLTSQPARAVWIEINGTTTAEGFGSSQPARAVWIEIPQRVPRFVVPFATACEGCVD